MYRPGRLEWTLSIVAHAAVVAFFWIWAIEHEPEVLFEAVAIDIYSPPAQELGVQEEPPVVEEDFQQQVEEIVQEEETPPPVVEEEKQEDPPPPDPVETTPPTPPDSAEEKPPEPPKSQNPDPDVEESGEDIQIRMEGLQRDFPAYYEGIVFHMTRCFRWNGDDRYRATVQFSIRKEGGLDRLQTIVEKSGNVAFDRAAMIAVGCAVTVERIGPLPEGMDTESLPVRFTFRGSGDGEMERDPQGSR